MGSGSVPRTLAITAGRWRPGDDAAALAAFAQALADDGVEALQVREKHLADREVFELLQAVVQRVGERLTVVVNGRPDLALAAGADGVHLPSRGLPTAAVRRRFPGLTVGRSTHTVQEILREIGEEAHYVTFGPVRTTPSKTRYGPPQGPGALASAVTAASGLPVLALGGIDADGLDDLAATGCHGVAGIRVFEDASARRELVAAVRERWPA